MERAWNAVSEEHILTAIKQFYKENKGNEPATDLILAIGAELLDKSQDKILEQM